MSVLQRCSRFEYGVMDVSWTGGIGRCEVGSGVGPMHVSMYNSR
jgi:hypothetical protein